MINTLKKIINHSTVLKKLLLPVYLAGGSMIFWIYKKCNLSFSYFLADETKVKFNPEGQITKGIFLGGFENKELEIFQSILNRGSIMIDAGANIGLYSIIGSRVVGNTGKVYSFEPSKANFNLFLKNIELNKIKNIIPVNMGLGDTIGESLILSQNFKNDDAEKYILKKEREIAISNQANNIHLNESVTLDTLDNFQLKNNIKKIDFLKIDVEGYEYYVLKGSENLLKNNPEIIILFECAGHLSKRVGSSQNAVFAYLHNLGFEIIYWNEKEKNWNRDLSEGANLGQFLAGKNILNTLHKLTLHKSNN